MISQENLPLTAVRAAQEVFSAKLSGEPIALVLITDGPSNTLAQRIAVKKLQNGQWHILGSFKENDLNSQAIGFARDVLNSSHLHGMNKHTVSTSSGETYTLFVEVHHPPPELIIFGAGHIGQSLSSIGTMLGFRVTVADDRKEFVTKDRFPDAHQLLEVDFTEPFKNINISHNSHFVLVTRGHKYDFECLRMLLRNKTEPVYIGMIGSRRRIRATFIQLMNDKIDPERLARIRAPLGLDIGSETPVEIAIAVAAELVLLSKTGDGIPLSQKEDIFNRFFKKK